MLAALLLALPQAASAGTLEDVLDEVPLTFEVNHSIALGVEYLKTLQRPDGSFPLRQGPRFRGGATALVTYTMLRSGVRRSDPVIARALASLAEVEFESVYSASVHLLMCAALRDEGVLPQAERSLDFLLRHQDEGVWAYPWGQLCNSNTQFALLGLRAAVSMGFEVDEEVWLDALDGLRMFHHRCGAFGYRPAKLRPYASITAGALASLGVLQEVAREHPRLRRALAGASSMRKEAEDWMEEHFDVRRHLFFDGRWERTSYRCLWAIERWCGLTGRERVDGRDWYREGAAFLVDDQALDGSWNTKGALQDTCFALLFLRRATVSGGEAIEELNAELEERRRARLGALHVLPGPRARRLTDWWMAGPWVKRSERDLLLEPPFEPKRVKPREGRDVGRREWSRIELDSERWTDMDLRSEDGGDSRLWLLSTWLCVPGNEDVEVILWLEIHDGWDLLLDGKRISRERHLGPLANAGASIDGNPGFPLRLSPGAHALTVLVEDFKGPAAFGMLLTDADNEAPLDGLVECGDPKAWKKGKR